MTKEKEDGNEKMCGKCLKTRRKRCLGFVGIAVSDGFKRADKLFALQKFPSADRVDIVDQMFYIRVYGNLLRQKTTAESISRGDGLFLVTSVIADDFQKLGRVVNADFFGIAELIP